MRRLLLLGCWLWFFAATPAAASPPQKEVSLSWERVGASALQEIDWNWRTILTDWSIRFHPGRPGYLALTNLASRQIDIWIRPEHSPEHVATTIVHELAHAFDRNFLTLSLRREWFKARDLQPDTSWYPPCSGCSDYRFGAGDFAESVSFTIQGGKADKFRSRLGLPPNKSQQALIRKWLSTLPPTAGN